MTTLSNIITWFNDNNGALMVLITVIYVIATISISRSNKKSADASRKQIEASQKQQEQNVGLQLYAMRKEVIDKLSKDKYNEVYWDIPLLFNNELFQEFSVLANRKPQIDELQKEVFTFELEFYALFDERAKREIERLRKEANTPTGLASLREYIEKQFEDQNIRTTASLEKYLEQVAQLHKIMSQCETEKEQVLKKLRLFIKDSIK